MASIVLASSVEPSFADDEVKNHAKRLSIQAARRAADPVLRPTVREATTSIVKPLLGEGVGQLVGRGAGALAVGGLIGTFGGVLLSSSDTGGCDSTGCSDMVKRDRYGRKPPYYYPPSSDPSLNKLPKKPTPGPIYVPNSNGGSAGQGVR